MENAETKDVAQNALKTAEVILQPLAPKDILGGPIFLVCNQIDNQLKQACLDFIKKQESIPKLNVFVCSFGGDPDVR